MLFHFFWRGRNKSHFFPFLANKYYFICVEEHPSAFLALIFFERIFSISHDWMANRMKMDPDLVRPASFRGYFKKGIIPKFFNNHIMRQGIPLFSAFDFSSYERLFPEVPF